MNMEGDFRFVTQAGLDELRVWADWLCIGNAIKSLCSGLEKPKDPFVDILLKFLGVKEELYHSIRCRIAIIPLTIVTFLMNGLERCCMNLQYAGHRRRISAPLGSTNRRYMSRPKIPGDPKFGT
ncbi:hypothetical protein PVL29_003650 [Vitis rotundifolia]|uniref:Uncharacterized protein n=1 Tax=Vitis rotundifolia TaxID=103349 RepID=A0AA39ADM1_VITRO|nr:hypothetical protein PVL29_003650 [Vitis rotundifolia]